MRSVRLAVFAVLAVLGFVAALAVARPTLAETPSPGPPGDDPIGRSLFPPDRVMGHAQEIGLDETQRAAIRAEVQKTSPKFTDLQFDLHGEMEKLSRLVAEKRVDEAKTLAQLDRILALEKEIKRSQIGMLVRIKNTLTPQQQDKLAELAKSER